MTKTKRYRLADALRVKAELDAMPHHEPEEISLREALTLLSPEIHTLRRKNYGWPAIVAMLAKGGIEVSPSVLKKRLSERRDAAGMKGSRKKAPKDESPRRPARTTAARSVAMPKSSAATEGDVQTDGPVTEGATGGGTTTTFPEAAVRGERPHPDAAAEAATTTPAGPPPPRARRGRPARRLRRRRALSGAKSRGQRESPLRGQATSVWRTARRKLRGLASAQYDPRR